MNRRDVLRLGAAGLLAAPFCSMLSPARASGLGTAKRLLVFFTPNGTIHSRWRPSSTGGLSFPAGSILEPLTPHASDLLILESTFNVGDNHEGGMGAMLTAGGPNSIDQVVADAISTNTRFRSLELGALTSAWGGSTQTRMCYRDGTLVTPDDDPVHAWSRLFGAVGDPRIGERRLSVLDLASHDLTHLRDRIGAEERQRLDAHMSSLRDLEQSLSAVDTCSQPAAPGTVSAYDNDSFPAIVKAQLDLAVQALACDVTRVATVQLSHTVGPVVFTWLGETEGHHSLSHVGDTNSAGVQSFVNCERWFAQQFAYLLEKLKTLPDAETGSPLLDSTVVLWAQELGDGRMHTCENVPWVLAGGGSFFTTGRHLQLEETHDAVLTSIANAVGLPLATFGLGSSGPAQVLR